MIRVFAGTAGAQAISPQLSWLWPSGLDTSSIAQAIILCIFIYWGWDACLAVGEETGPGRTPGIAAVITTLILVCTYVLVAYAVQSFAGFGDVGIGLNNAMNTDDVLTVLGKPVAGTIAASLLLLTVRCRRVVDTDHDPADRSRNALDGGVRGDPEAVRQRPSALHDPGVRHHRDGAVRAVLLPDVDVPVGERTRRLGGLAGTGGGVLLRHHRVRLRLVLPQDAVLVGAKPVLPRRFPADRRPRDGGAFGISAKDMMKPDYGYTAFGPVGGMFVLGVGMLVLGIPLMLACFAFGTKRFFRGETLTAQTEVKVPDTY